MEQPPSEPVAERGHGDPPKVATILVTLGIKNNSRFVRGKKRTLPHVENFYLDQYDATGLPNGKSERKVRCDTDEDLDDGHCFSESEARMERTDRRW